MENPITKSNNILAGLFKDYKDAAEAYQAVLNKGYEPKEISLLMSDETRDKYFPNSEENPTTLGSKTLEGMGVGSAIGGTIGAIAAAIMATGTSLVFPGLGIAISGPLAASFAGGGAGSFTGWLIGAFVGSAIPNDRAKIYETAIKEGGIVISFSPHSEEEAHAIESEWKKHHGENILIAA